METSDKGAGEKKVKKYCSRGTPGVRLESSDHHRRSLRQESYQAMMESSFLKSQDHLMQS